ncbi:long-chain fatty acid transport protein 1-like [Periplaneta americana]|uniref:long-chain fatty acid transport protein 1-like n=1 Tax=Periplaneta americana TaxID=6978 RepID=UPI0037E790E1
MSEKLFWLLAAIAVAGIAAGFVPFSWYFLVTLLALLVTWYRRRIYVAIVMLPRDMRLIYRFGKLIWSNYVFDKNNTTLLTLFKERVEREPEKPCYYFGDKIWTVADVEEFSNRIANVFLAAGYRKGDVVGLFMGNCPEYVCIWLGLAKLGVITALVNNNLRSHPLIHSLNAANTKAVITSGELSAALQEVVGSLDFPLDQYQLGGELSEKNNVKNLSTLLESASTTPPDVETPGYKDRMLYIYTSGTTGLPKAAVMPHSRYLLITMAVKYLLALTPDDVMYNPLPMYHSAGGIIGTGPALVHGNPIVLRTKFSASSYWTDCIKYKCTIAQYIGEMCRYIMAVPRKPEDTRHHIRLMVGNGMRSTIWKDFVERFKIEQVTELYASTEGNVNILNIDNRIGAVGCMPQCVPQSLLPVGLVRVDPETNEPVRDRRGLCIRCEAGEPGMFVGLISSSNAIRDYHGYVDKKASSKKVLHDVFGKGDKAFLSGDILVMDKYGYLYFKDRTGDTFRWKGENVATAEVESVIINVIGLKDAAVYGVQVPDQEGRAGMAAIADPNKSLDFKNLAEYLDKTLPSYARPIFIRVLEEMDMTGTFKIKKNELQEDGFDPIRIKDKIYFRSGKDYVPLTSQLYQDILKGIVRI